MPNWCTNTVLVKGSTEDIKALKEKVTKEDNPFSLNAIKPLPKPLLNVSAPAKFNETPQKVAFNTKTYGAADWYDWCNQNWGTKWDTSNAEIASESDTFIEYRFDTAWAPPIPVYEELARQFPNTNIFINYDESGGGFAGWNSYDEGVEKSSRQFDESYMNMRMYMEPDLEVFEWV